ncbi:unnamed protein product, partial [Pylaiella littoralis]
VQALLEHLEVNGLVLDCCGSTRDAPSMVLTGYGLHVVTNDVDHKLIADSHMDVTTRDFYDLFSQETRRPDWIVSSPPYQNAFAIWQQALRIVRKGVAFKLRLNFLEPTKSRGPWLAENYPELVVVLPRASYRGRQSFAVEVWFVWWK